MIERKCKNRIELRCRGNAKKKKKLNVLKNSDKKKKKKMQL